MMPPMAENSSARHAEQQQLEHHRVEHRAGLAEDAEGQREEEGGAVEEGFAEQVLEVDQPALAHRDADEKRQEERRRHREQQAEQRADDDREDQLLRRR